MYKNITVGDGAESSGPDTHITKLSKQMFPALTKISSTH